MGSFDVAVVGMGALGSAAAYQLALRGASVVAFEQYELGHVRGASHDTSRIVRTANGSPALIRLSQAAYRDWADLERESGERQLTRTGGLVSIPHDGPFSAAEFTAGLAECGVEHEVLGPDQVHARWPQFALPDGVDTVFTADSGIAHASRTVATLQLRARAHGADIRERTRVDAIEPSGHGVIVRTEHETVRARTVIVAADAWTDALLAPLGVRIPLDVMQEQVTYFAPERPDDFASDRFPVWVWLDHECYYGFPAYGEPSIKAARDVSFNRMDPGERTFVPSPELSAQLDDFVHGIIPAAGRELRTVTCQYALTPDRNFVLGPVPGHPEVVTALTAGHGFKYTPAIGRVLAELALDGESTEDIAAFAVPAQG